MKIKVSVIVPIFNVEEYLHECLDSLDAQTLKELEVIMINDGSLDSSGAIAQEYTRRNPERFLYFEKENGGLSSARNYGVLKARGEYIGFVDSDDYVEPSFMEEMYESAVNENADIVCCSYVDDYGNRKHKRYYDPARFGLSVLDSPKILRYANSIACNKIYRLDFWKTNAFRFPEGQWFEDSALIYNVMLVANKVALVNYPFYYYRRTREKAITKQADPRIFHIFNSIQSIIDFYKSRNAFDTVYKDLEYISIRHITARFKVLLGIKDKQLARKYVRKAYAFLDEAFPEWRKSRYMNPQNADLYQKLSTFTPKSKWLCIAGVSFPKAMEALKHRVASVKQQKSELSKKDRQKKTKKTKRKYIQKNGMLVLRDLQEILQEMGIVSFADFGTCLGLIREGKLLAHDLDVDVGVIAGAERREEIRMNLEKRGYKLWRQYVHNCKVVEESYLYYRVKIDLNYYEMTKSNAHTWLFYTKPGYQYNDALTRHIVRMDYSPISGVYTQDFNGIRITLPQNPEKLLEEKYGPNWRIPDTNWIYWQSPAATPLEEIGHIISYDYAGSINPHEKRNLHLTNYERKMMQLFHNLDYESQIRIIQAAEAISK